MNRRPEILALVTALGLFATALSACQTGPDQSVSSATSPTTSTTTSPPTTTSTTTTIPGPPPAGPVGNPWPDIGPTPLQHHAILTLGDSLMGGATSTLETNLASHGFNAVVYDGHVNGTGLLDPVNGISARELFQEQLTYHPDIDTVVFGWSGVCAVACGTSTLRYGSPEFYATWHDEARKLVDLAWAHGLQVVWVTAPPPRLDSSGQPPTEDWMSYPMRPIVQTRLAQEVRKYPNTLGVPVADVWQALSDTSGQWQQSLWYDGALHEVRVDDFVHLTDDGSLRASTWVVAALARLYHD
jgi:hypothetical protein